MEVEHSYEIKQLQEIISKIKNNQATRKDLGKGYELAKNIKDQILKNSELREQIKHLLFPYAIYKQAEEIVNNLSTKKGKDLEEYKKKLRDERFGYFADKGRNDCYDFLMHLATDAAFEIGIISSKKEVWKEVVDEKKGKIRYKVSFFSSDIGRELIGRGKGALYPLVGPDVGNEEILKPGKELTFQPGCFIFVDHSRTGANHWAIYTEKGFLMHRGEEGIGVIGLENFFRPLERRSKNDANMVFIIFLELIIKRLKKNIKFSRGQLDLFTNENLRYLRNLSKKSLSSKEGKKILFLSFFRITPRIFSSINFPLIL